MSTKKWVSELVHMCYEDGQKVAIVHQNGVIEVFILKPATKQDVADLLEVENAK